MCKEHYRKGSVVPTKFRITNNDVINVQAHSKHLRIDVQLESLERGKRETLHETSVNGVLNIRQSPKFLNSRESRGTVLLKLMKMSGRIASRLVH